MRIGINLVCNALEVTLKEIGEAMAKARFAGDRMAERNLDMRREQLTVELRKMRDHEEYITQPRFVKYF